MITSPIKFNVVYSLATFGSESKPEERGTSDEGASDEVRADLLDTRTVQVMNGTDQRDFYRNIIGLNRSLLRLNVQPKRSDRERSPCAASGLGFDCVRIKLVCKYYSAELLRLGLNCFRTSRAHFAQDDSGNIA